MMHDSRRTTRDNPRNGTAATFRTRLRAGLAGAMFALGSLALSLPLNAQAPLYLPDQIPLDVAASAN
jgi:hypothetical protein